MARGDPGPDGGRGGRAGLPRSRGGAHVRLDRPPAHLLALAARSSASTTGCEEATDGLQHQQPGKVKKADLIIFGVALAVIVRAGDLGRLVGGDADDPAALAVLLPHHHRARHRATPIASRSGSRCTTTSSTCSRATASAATGSAT